MAYSYDLINKKRDLTEVLDTDIAAEPRFISNFKNGATATQRKHEWLEDQIGGRSIEAVAVSENVATVSAADAAKVRVGTLLNAKDDAAVFQVTAVSGTSVTVALVGANGSKLSAPAEGVMEIIGTPTEEGSTEGENVFRQAGTEYNATTILRKDIVLTGTALAVTTYDGANDLTRQTRFAMMEAARDLNRLAIKGVRVDATASTKGIPGGLYFFGTQEGGLAVPLAAPTKLDSFIINDAAAAILGAGGNPTQILCSPGQARILSAEMRDQLQIVRADNVRGAYVATVINDVNGSGMTIIADPDMPDTDVWGIDPAGFALSYLKGRTLTDEDSTPKGYDGIRRTAIGELTFEFKNAKSRLCRISNLMPSAEAIAALKA
jgi:hypothetical protein